jgi:PKD repeat protein
MKHYIIGFVVLLCLSAKEDPLYGQCGTHITSITYTYEGNGTYNCVVQGTDSTCKLLRLEVLNGRTVLRPRVNQWNHIWTSSFQTSSCDSIKILPVCTDPDNIHCPFIYFVPPCADTTRKDTNCAVSFSAMNIKTACDTLRLGHAIHGYVTAATFSFGIHGNIAALGNSTVYLDFGDGSALVNLNQASHTQLCVGPVNNMSCDYGYTIVHRYSCPGIYAYHIVSFCKYSGMYLVLDSGMITIPVCACPPVQMLSTVSIDPVTKQPRCAFSLGATFQPGICVGSYSVLIWNYGDQMVDTVYGNTSGTDTIWSPVHTYTTEGVYPTSLTLVVNGKPACTYTGSVNVQANCCAKCPTVNFVQSPTVNNTVNFVANITPSPCNVKYDSCLWIFGDGTSERDLINLMDSSYVSTQHTYTNQCRYRFQAYLILIGPGIACTYDDPKPVIVSCCMACPNISLPAPTTDFDTAFFTATVPANSCDNQFTSCTWNFGDGTTSPGTIDLQKSNVIKANHVYSLCQQSYTATLTLNGQTISCSQSTPASFTMAPLANTFWQGPCTWTVPLNFARPPATANVADNSLFTINFQGYSSTNGCMVNGNFSIYPLYCYNPGADTILCSSTTIGGFQGTIIGNTLNFPKPIDFLLPIFADCMATTPCVTPCLTCGQAAGIPFTGNMYFNGDLLYTTPNSFNCQTGAGISESPNMQPVPTFMIINATKEVHP